jgi:hypothetical protein
MSVRAFSRAAFVTVMAAHLAGGVVWAQARSLAAVRLPRAVVADGKPLPAGTYGLRLADEPVTPVVGQPPSSSRWVEFVQDGDVKGRELATVIQPADVKAVAKGTPPAAGSARVQLLRGAEYLRVWTNVGGTQYLVHLATGGTK